MITGSAYRVVAGRNPFPEKLYEGDDIHAAAQAFYDAWPKDEACNFRTGTHSVTGEPMIEMRRAEDNTMAAALYGVSAERWAEISIFWGMLPAGMEDEDDMTQKDVH